MTPPSVCAHTLRVKAMDEFLPLVSDEVGSDERDFGGYYQYKQRVIKVAGWT